MPDGVQDVVNPTVWSDAGGILGLIILALFVVLGLLLWMHDRTSRANTKDINETLKGISKDHSSERTEWRATIEKSNKETRDSHEKMGEAIKELTIAIRTSKPE